MACETALSRKYTAYPEYVPSGVDSTPEMPSHWIAGKVKYVTDSLDKIRVPLSSEERGSRKGEYPYYGASGIIDYVDDYLFDEETILFGEDGANLIARSSPLAFLAKGKYWVNNHAHILRTKDGVNNFWVMSFENIDVRTVVSGSAQPKLTAEALGDLELVYPPTISEREQIANFLDHETAKIDTLIEKQQQLIKLLKEKRQAVISHAVTKGLNPNVLMRDSGVEWLGEVPVHWEVRRINLLFSESSARASTEDELNYPVLSVSIHHGISDKELNAAELDRKVQRSEDKSLYKVVHENVLAYNMMRAWQGGFGASKLSGLVSPAYVVCQPKTQLDSYYFELALRTPNAVTELKRFSRGITDFVCIGMNLKVLVYLCRLKMK
jgi:type I restriction enzyme S subunit